MEQQLSKKLETRHISMIAIGGSIGTGIFLASGYSISVAGPGGALAGYSIMAILVYFLMTSLGEMSAYNPSSGSLCDYSTKYVGKSFGFAMGYNYWLNWAITIAAEISATAMITSYWFPQVNPVYFSLIFFAAVFICNLFAVTVYGEIEYWLSFLKVAVIVVFIVLGLLAIFHTPHFGADNWKIGDAPFHGGWLGFISVFLFAGFSFQGTELVGVASGETKNPEVTIPKSIKMVFWRLVLFYILSILIIGLLVKYTDTRLTYQDNIGASPYTMVFAQYIGKYAGDLINLIILIALISAANASMYSATRILWHLAKTKQAPQQFAKLTRHGLPLNALIITALIGSVVFVSSAIGNGKFFDYIVQISSLSGFIAWLGIATSHYYFRKRYMPSIGLTVDKLKYTAKFYPYAQLFSIFAICFIIIAQFITFESNYKFIDFIAVYSAVILFIIIFIGHMIYTKLQRK